MERIKSAAIYFAAEGQVLEGSNHAECFQKAKQLNYCRTRLDLRGFVTESGSFLNEFEALNVAKQAGQVPHKYPPTDRLISKDLEAAESTAEEKSSRQLLEMPDRPRKQALIRLSKLEEEFNWLIAVTPTGKARNRLTEMNLLRLEVMALLTQKREREQE